MERSACDRSGHRVRLIVDIGNTRAKWALCREGRIESTGAAPTGVLNDSVGWAEALAGISRPDDVIVGCVGARTCLKGLEDLTLSAWVLRPRIMRTGKTSGRIVNGYTEPETLGVDRWAAIVAAGQKTPGALCVVDAGSACTVDVVDPRGCHQGGWIVPGLGMQAELLSSNTQAVRPARVAPAFDWGRNTTACVANGGLASLSGLIELACARAEREWTQVTCILTGGDAGHIASVLARPVQEYPSLVIEGLDLLASSEGDSL